MYVKKKLHQVIGQLEVAKAIGVHEMTVVNREIRAKGPRSFGKLNMKSNEARGYRR